MSETAPPTISFAGYHKPGLSPVQITLNSTVALAVSGVTPNPGFSSEMVIFFSGPRFVFSPAEIYAVFPPRDSLGEFDNVLPHVELTPSTLPWQRSAQPPPKGASGSIQPDPPLPWLALILLQEDEWQDPSKISMASMSWEDLRKKLGLTEEPTDLASDGEMPLPPVKVLQIDKDFCKKILPATEEWASLAHVRVAQAEERAVLVCNRMPRPGTRAEVHLVSLEGRLDAQGTFDLTKGLKEGKKIPLLSLQSWQFTCPLDLQFKVSDKAISKLAGLDLGAKFPLAQEREQLYCIGARQTSRRR